MDIDTIKKQLKEDGYSYIYEWTDEPNTEYLKHSHQGRVSFYIVDGTISINIDGTYVSLRKDDKFDVPVGIPHTAKVGTDGCTFIVGEEIEGDS